MRSMPTEIKKNRPDDQITSCFLKLYTPTRVCEIIIRNWSAGQPVSPNKPDDIRRNGRKESRHSMPGKRRKKSRMTSGTMDERKAGIQCRGKEERKAG